MEKIPDDIINKLVENDIYICPTLEVWNAVSREYNVDAIGIAQDSLGRFVRAGGNVNLGTDFGAGVVEHSFELGMPMTEIRLVREAGLTPMHIIMAATKNAAYVCDRVKQLIL